MLWAVGCTTGPPANRESDDHQVRPTTTAGVEAAHQPNNPDAMLKQLDETPAEKRAALAKQFVEQYPDHPREADVLHMWAEALLRTNAPYDEFAEVVNRFVQLAPTDERGGWMSWRAASLERDPAKKQKMMRDLIERYPRTYEAKVAEGRLRRVEAIGQPFELAFTDAISGKPVSMNDLRGKVVVVEGWATWCGPCIEELPQMKELYAQYHGQVEFIGVSFDAERQENGLEKLRQFVKQHNIGWPQYYLDEGMHSDFATSWGINGVPTMFVIDADGKLQSTDARGRLGEMIPELLAKRDK